MGTQGEAVSAGSSVSFGGPIIMDPDLLAELQELPIALPSSTGVLFTKDMDDAIMYAFENGVRRDHFAQWFSTKFFPDRLKPVCKDTLRTRYRLIKRERDNG